MTRVLALLDGTRLDPDQPLLTADDQGVVRGDGIFETTLVHDGVVRDLDEHLARLAASASMTDLVLPPAEAWRTGVEAVLAGWAESASAGQDMVLRLVATRGREGAGVPTCFVMGFDVSPRIAVDRAEGVKVLTLARGFTGTEAAGLPWLLAGAKTLSYSVNMAAQRYAAAAGADDVIFVGGDGHILEAPTATVVINRGRTLLTPPLPGILAGITVARLFAAAAVAGFDTRSENLTVEDLRQAEGVWLLSSVRLLAPVVSVDGVARPIGPLTPELAALLQVPRTLPVG